MGKAKRRQREKKHAQHYKTKGKPAEVKKPRPAKAAQAKPPTPSIIPYGKNDRILLLGEGDFSFARSLVSTHACEHVLATCFDSEKELRRKYPQAEEHIALLRSSNQRVLYGVDATKLAQKPIRKPPALPAPDPTVGAYKTEHEDSDAARSEEGWSSDGVDADEGPVPAQRERGWDVISFNFPHVGGLSTDVNRQVRHNQSLLVSFFGAALPLLTPSTGVILVTLFEGEPYTLWNVRDLARHSGLRVERSWRFDAKAYPGYKHARTLGNVKDGSGWKGEDRSARTYAFAARDAPEGLVIGNVKGGATKVIMEASDDEEGG